MPLDNFEVIEIDDNELDASTPDATSNFNTKEQQDKPNTTSFSKPEEGDLEVDIEPDKEVEVKKPDDKKVDETEESKVAEEKKVDKPKKDKEKEAAKVVDDIDFKVITQALIDEDIFSDFEEKDSIEYTPETFKELLKEQALAKANEEYEKLLSGFDEQTLQFIEYSKNGGDLVSLAQSQKQIQDVEEADISDAEVAEQVIAANYEAKGKSSKWVKSYIDTLKDKGTEALTEEAEESKKELLTLSKEEKDRQINAAKEATEKHQFIINKFNSDIKKVVNSDSSLTPSEQRNLEGFLTLNKKLKNGNIVNDLQVKLFEIQNDPKAYAELGKFLQDMDAYKNKISKKSEKEVVKSTMKILKGKSTTSQANSYLPESTTIKSKNPFAIT